LKVQKLGNGPRKGLGIERRLGGGLEHKLGENEQLEPPEGRDA